MQRFTGQLAPEQTKTVTLHPFSVAAGVRGITLDFDYGPRRCEDPSVCRPLVTTAFRQHAARRISTGETTESEMMTALGIERRSEGLDNLLNVVLIDPEGRWRGRWDRSPSGSEGILFLGEDGASRGFIAGAIQPGEWQAAVECHGVYGEPVTYTLTLDTTAESRATARGKTVATSIPPRAATGSKERWYLGELHSHSVHSDGNHEIEELAGYVAETGAEFLALTDHNTMSGHELDLELPLTLLRGFELTTFAGHHPIYGMSEMIPWHQNGKVRTLAEMAPEMRARDGLIGIAHPFVPGDPLCTGCRMVEGLSPGDFDMMEVWYRRWNSPGADNVAAYNYWNRLWAEGHRIIGVAARDWHRPDQAQPFPGEFPLTAIWSQNNSAESLMENLRAGRAVMTGGPLLTAECLDSSDAVIAGIGDSADLARVARLRVGVTRMVEPCELRLLRDNQVVAAAQLRSDDSVDFGALPGPGAYRVELWSTDRPRALSNHITVL